MFENSVKMEWEKRNTVGKDRVTELTELYESLGFEVKVERYAGPENGGEVCEGCYGDSAGEYFVVYTRKKDSRYIDNS